MVVPVKKALLTTSQVRFDTLSKPHLETVATETSSLLNQLVEKGYEVHILTTRPGLLPKLDACWFGKVASVYFIPAGRGANAREAIDAAWMACQKLNIPVPSAGTHLDRNAEPERTGDWQSWEDAFHWAAEAGWFVGWSRPYKDHGLNEGKAFPTFKYLDERPAKSEGDINF